MSNSKLEELWFRYVKGEKLNKAEVQAACEADPPGVKDFIRRLVVGEPMSDFDPPTAEDLAEAEQLRKRDHEFLLAQKARYEFRSHCRCYLMPMERILLCLQGLYILEGLPEDAEFVNVYQRLENRAFGIVIASKEFERVPDGAETPLWPAWDAVGMVNVVEVGETPDGPRFVCVRENQKIEKLDDGRVRFREFL